MYNVSNILLSVLFKSILYQTPTVAVFEFLATAARAWVIASRQLILDDRSAWLRCSSVMSGSCSLIRIA